MRFKGYFDAICLNHSEHQNVFLLNLLKGIIGEYIKKWNPLRV